ncbi:hypothetical protein GCM10009037_07030 [Halarchaeum grantii]|uniref:Uncharacterized protein n=1 Tax=Halarchaeum grantii TaxID=1193105 RepID=A0A830F6Y3_9EURY|nr:hypothetical protein [Halarchaeum grantii]GGL25994.1 hypothetical protein GCM10009037_07030 [Halarchaeum grantii]
MSDAEHGPPTRTVTEHLPWGQCIRAHLHDEHVTVHCDGERWVFAIDIETARLLEARSTADVPSWMRRFLEEVGFDEVEL